MKVIEKIIEEHQNWRDNEPLYGLDRAMIAPYLDIVFNPSAKEFSFCLEYRQIGDDNKKIYLRAEQAERLYFYLRELFQEK
jgi:hypothetical protein